VNSSHFLFSTARSSAAAAAAAAAATAAAVEAEGGAPPRSSAPPIMRPPVARRSSSLPPPPPKPACAEKLSCREKMAGKMLNWLSGGGPPAPSHGENPLKSNLAAGGGRGPRSGEESMASEEEVEEGVEEAELGAAPGGSRC
jgi:hypothetical protein